jgi:hypothetical protein
VIDNEYLELLKPLSSEIDPAEIIGSFERSLLKRNARRVFRKIHPSPIFCEPVKVTAP